MNFIEWCIVGAIVLILGSVFYGGHQEYNSPKIEIKKSDFECTRKETVRRLRPQLVGKITVMIPYDDEVCTNYKRVAP